MRELDGKNLFYGFLAGAGNILKNQQQLNAINVFPVSDADTGTNMASTIKSVIETVRPDESFKTTMDLIAEAALDGARGNSGVIFSQFLYGISREAKEQKRIDTRRFAHLIRNAVLHTYEALADPVEGTMITVMKDWSIHLDGLKEKSDDFIHMITHSYQSALKSLRETPQKLEVLARANVVDAGAKGFVLFLEGIIDLMKHKNLKKILAPRRSISVLRQLDAGLHQRMSHRYCTEAIIEGKDLDMSVLKNAGGEFGDSVVAAGSRKKMRVHVHTDSPADLFQRLSGFGLITRQRVDDIQRQYEAAHERKWDIALVVDSACDLPQSFIDEHQIHVVPLNLFVGGNHFLDKVTITPDRFYELADASTETPTTAGPSVKEFVDRYSFLASKYASVIAVNLSGSLSGTWATSVKAAERVTRETGKRVTVVDSRHLSGSMGLMVMRIAGAIENGMSHDAIVDRIEDWGAKTRLLVSVRTMKNLVRSGRVSPMKGLLAGMLNLTPVLSIEQGKVFMHGKAFSHRGNMKKVIGTVKRLIEHNRPWNYAILHSHDEGTAAWFTEQLTPLFKGEPAFVMDISPVIGLHVGSGAVAVAVMFE